MRKNRYKTAIIVLVSLIIMTIVMVSGCGKKEQPADNLADSTSISGMTAVVTPNIDKASEKYQESVETKENPADNSESEDKKSENKEPEDKESEGPEIEKTDEEVVKNNEQGTKPQIVQLDGSGKVVCIDAGHQAKGNNEKEPIGPGASTTKPKVSSGTRGVSTGVYEYELTLVLAQKVQSILESQGYTVIMVRTSHDVNISNSERAAVANNAGANAFVRIHADGSENSSVNGCSTLCQTSSNPYNGSIYSASKSLATYVVNDLAAATGAKNRGVTETDTMSGINWASVPTCIVEVGFMSNPDEDSRMNTDDYRNNIAAGIANGIMEYLSR